MATELGADRTQGIAFLVSAGIVYEIIAAACSSPQTTEINASSRADTLMKWVHLGIGQAAVFIFLAAYFDPAHRPAILGGGILAGGLMYGQYVHARSAGLRSSAPGTESWPAVAWSIFQQGGGQQAAVQWAVDFLAALGAPQSPGNVQFVYDWELAEGGGGKFNPLNQGPVPGQASLTSTGSQYGGGAADFVTYQAGIQGAVDYLHMANFSKIAGALQNNDPVAARAALIASPWAASHYNGGKNFPNTPIPGGAQAIPVAGNQTPGVLSNNSGSTVTAGVSGCAISLPSVAGLGGGCILHNSNLKALKGGLLIAAGGVMFLVGGLVLVAYGFQRTSAGREASQTAGAVTRGATTVGGLVAAPGPAVRATTAVSRPPSNPATRARLVESQPVSFPGPNQRPLRPRSSSRPARDSYGLAF